MMQVTTVYILLITFVVGRINTVQGTDTCVEKCTDECKATCPEQIICSEDEIDCGPGAPPENPFCETDMICVASNCNCKYLCVINIKLIEFVSLLCLLNKNYILIYTIYTQAP